MAITNQEEFEMLQKAFANNDLDTVIEWLQAAIQQKAAERAKKVGRADAGG